MQMNFFREEIIMLLEFRKVRLGQYYLYLKTQGFLDSPNIFFFFQELNFLVKSFGLLNELFPLPSILDAGYLDFDLYLTDVLFGVILPSVLGFSL
jgi:hypothetical protein